MRSCNGKGIYDMARRANSKLEAGTASKPITPYKSQYLFVY